MRARYLTSLAAVAAAFFWVGCLPAAAQSPFAEPGSPIKPIMAPPVAAKTASHSKPSKKTSSKDVVHVYLLRGLLNVFSLGMDELADKIRATGLQASVHNHTEWEELANEITAKYKAGNHAPIILIGHSLGADAVVYMAQYLGKRGIPVALLVPFDGTQTMVASSNVAHMMNITQRDYAYARRGSGFHGEFQNIDVTSMGVDHLSIDKAPRLHAMVLSKIASIVKRGEVPSNFASVPGEKEKEHTAPAPHHPAPAVAAKPEPQEPAKSEIETAAKPAEAPDAAKPAAPAAEPAAAPVAAAPAASDPSAAAPAATPATTASAAPVSAPAASAPKPVSATAAVTPAAPPPATERLEYEKLVLPKH